MRIDSLRLFLDVARQLSFAEVASDRDLDPSSVSRTITQLERELGVRLFQRTTRSVSLTEAGEGYYRNVVEALDQLDHAREQARLLSAGPTGTLRLTASVAFGERLIVPLLARFRHDYPDVQLDLVFTDTKVDLVSEQIDLAVRLGPPPIGDVVATRLFSTRYRVVASPAYLEDSSRIEQPADLATHRCSVFGLPSYRSVWRFRPAGSQDDQGNEKVAISPGTIVHSALSLRSVVIGGGGPALLADWLIADDLAAGTLVDLLPRYDVTATGFDTAAYLLYPTRTYLPQKVRVAIDFLKTQLPR
ncbi:MAG: LysR family transcriptional regulator [Pseudomonadota bacterium]